MSQLALPLDWPERESEADFVASPANEAALRHLAHWSTWPVPVTLLLGPRKSGRSLLGRLFAAQTGGRLIDDGWRQPEETIFHAWNAALASRRPLLIVADDDEHWTPGLPDLRSRLVATPRARLLPPDDALLLALIERGLARRGLAAPAGLAAWVASRIERSYVAAAQAIDALDRAALSRHRRLTQPLAREALIELRVIDA